MKLYIFIFLLIAVLCNASLYNVTVNNAAIIDINPTNTTLYNEPVWFAVQNVTSPVNFFYRTTPSGCLRDDVVNVTFVTDENGENVDYLTTGDNIPVGGCNLYVIIGNDTSVDNTDEIFLTHLSDQIEADEQYGNFTISTREVRWSILDGQLEMDIENCLLRSDLSRYDLPMSMSVNTLSGLNAHWIDITDYSKVGSCDTKVNTSGLICCQLWTVRTSTLDSPCITSTLGVEFVVNDESTLVQNIDVDDCKPDSLVQQEQDNTVVSAYTMEATVYSDDTLSTVSTVAISDNKYYVVTSIIPSVADDTDRQIACHDLRSKINYVIMCSQEFDANNNTINCNDLPVTKRYYVYNAKTPIAKYLQDIWGFEMKQNDQCSNSLILSWNARKFSSENDNVTVSINYHYFSIARQALDGYVPINTTTLSMTMTVECPADYPRFDDALQVCIYESSVDASVIVIIVLSSIAIIISSIVTTMILFPCSRSKIKV